MKAVGAASLALGTLAVITGAAFLWSVGALSGMPSRNVAAYLMGLLLGWVGHHVAHRRHGAEALFALSSALLALVLIGGVELDGVKRWLPLGPVHLQPALILSPLLLALAASREGRHWRALVLIPLALVVAQPDAATSVALATAIAMLVAAASQRSRRGWSQRRIATAAGALCLAILGLIVAGIPTPPPVAFVEGTVEIAMLSGALPILLHAMALGLALAALLRRHDAAGAALAAYFAVSAIAAVFLAFPMPIVGAGPSHLIGFGLAIGWLAVSDRLASRSAPAG
ncbi:MAG: FtsW/RodA/SpoVE family cell cycle protein [Pseudomonadota bacterium]|nr:FtsW/RodA/SpoVE family cell cycle protein [Pseudomonadota bacterium]